MRIGIAPGHDGGITKIIDNLTKVCDQTPHPVYWQFGREGQIGYFGEKLQ